MVAPATDQIVREFGITSTVIIAIATPIFILGYAFGALVLGRIVFFFVYAYKLPSLYFETLIPTFRNTVWSYYLLECFHLAVVSSVIQLANGWYLVWNLACGGVQTTGELIAFLFPAGLGGSAPLAVGGAVLGDCWCPEKRGQAIAFYTPVSLLGPVIGPLCGAWIAESFRFRAASIERKAQKIRKGLGLSKEDSSRVSTTFQRTNVR
ncbi:hypothetical protein M0805_004186 [Coniferiporia weirii]|nr:hypothetical protein M0805_004186 [Coniferiporia weirii]